MSSHFDILILGTGLTESIAAAALSKAGFKVAHVDTNEYYSGDEACLSAEEISRWSQKLGKESDKETGISKPSCSSNTLTSPRAYSISLAPSIIPSVGPLITSLIDSGVARYGGFKLLESLVLYSDGAFKSVPVSKEDIFKSKDISLVDKRRLMRFLIFASGSFESSTELAGKENMPFMQFLRETFSLNDDLASAVVYALALCTSTSDTTITGITRIRAYLHSVGRYGPSPFLVGHYGGLGELAQRFCRACAVSGGTYILGREIVELDLVSEEDNTGSGTQHRLRLGDIEDDVTAGLIIASANYLNVLAGAAHEDRRAIQVEEQTAHAVVVIDGPIISLSHETQVTSEQPVNDDESASQPEADIDTALLVFPIGSLSSGGSTQPVSVLLNGEGTLSCPSGKSLLYLSALVDPQAGVSDPEELLRPYLNATLSTILTSSRSKPAELFASFYIRSGRSATPTLSEALKRRRILTCPSLPSHFATNGDTAAVLAEEVYRESIRILRTDTGETESFWPPLQADYDDEDDA